MQISINQQILIIKVADTFFSRFMGLMFRKQLTKGEALLIAPCNSIHMCWMRFSIDAVYIDENYKVLKVVKNLYPWIGLSACWKAWGVIEMAAGSADSYGITEGMRLFKATEKE